jgi:hypothetical protein
MSDITNSTDPILTEHGDDRLEAIAEYIESLTAEATLQIGAQLAKARDIFRYRRDEGGFAGWVETRLRYSRQTAYNLLHVHERFGGQEVSKRLDTLARSVLFLVSSPSCPPEARDQIIKQAKAGEAVSVAETKDIIKTAKGQQPARKSRKRSATPAEIRAFKRVCDKAKRSREGDDVGPESNGEIERLRARNEQLQAELRQRDIKITGLESEIAELKARCEPASAACCEICRKKNRATRRPVFVCDFCAEIHELAAPPGDDGPDIPGYLDRNAPAKAEGDVA